MTLRVAIIGCGWVAGSQMSFGFDHLKDRYSVAIACDSDVGKARAFADTHGIAGIATDYDAVLADPDIEVVSICTPPSLHHPMVMAALRAGKHVICEKPFTSSLRLTDEIIAEEAKGRARVMPIFQYRFAPGIQRIRQILETGIAGACYIASVETAWKRGAEYYAVPWRGKFATEMGGVLLTQAIHIHDLLLYLRGPAAEVKAFKTTRVNQIEVEDCAVAAVRMEDGSLASLTATLGSQRPVTRIRLCYENLTIERQCFDAEAPKPGEEPWIIVPKNDEIAARIAAIPITPLEHTSFAYQFAAFHDALRDGGEMPVSLADARRSMELVTALYHASETGETVSLPIGADHERYGGWITPNSYSRYSTAASQMRAANGL
ncbi:Predicted dehydrogenase [Devosia enhydra]|uniref:Predicted dehydrogenase n=1 Tax=Devosia enhydra TaxID=665118 RepID=A0A1K2HSM2_9HYPH|nr:Gfo/Idh/MocA family oxidoreductase [Devosia enhydra]SFZ80708.1 Predicted dehydrogenase [Devosia enhydra]